ncbi:TetR/AcrR family transcriptional regulator [Intrasporangium calvum]|uniref:TetR/AcrR family transcriptional regulator n=1 Tax=Intrasporangium calvum TaxID=53358 RepID=UPI000DF622EB|nr:TetR/AcrR family transcriptional regulator [Intrasporangium calvum]AXG12712.1 TetR/AcrR family transcriptional regulator [Intrasporangium calvum]
MTSPDDALLAAVRDEVLDYGVRRATATSIAHRAGVSRVTVHRRGGTIRQLVLDALVAEFTGTMEDCAARVATEAPPRTGRDTVVEMAVALVDALSEAPLVGALLKHDPDLLLPYLVDRYGRSQLLALDAISAALRAGVADGSVVAPDPDLTARVLLQALTPFVVGMRILTGDHDRAHVLAEVRRLVSSYLAPASHPEHGQGDGR